MTRKKNGRNWALNPLQLVLGLVIWSGWFVLLYGGLSVACALAMPPVSYGSVNWLNGLLLSLTLATVILLLYLGYRCWQASDRVRGKQRKSARFIAQVSAALHAMAAGATLATGLPALVLPPCI